MSTIQHTIDVNVPLRQVYDQWTQFEDFPHFMDGVDSVRQLDDTRLHWIATVGGKRKEWDAVITEQLRDQRVAWTSTTGTPNAGMVEFTPVSDMRTRVTLTIDIVPEGGVETVGDALGIPSGQVKDDLERFKAFIEERGSATGAWRGEVEDGRVTTSSGSATGPASLESDRLGSAFGAPPSASRSAAGTSTAGTSDRNAYGTLNASELAGNAAGTGASRTVGGGFAEGQASDAGERELATAGSSMDMSGGATPDDPYGIGRTSGTGLESSTDYDRSLGQPGYGSVGTESDLETPVESGARRRVVGDI